MGSPGRVKSGMMKHPPYTGFAWTIYEDPRGQQYGHCLGQFLSVVFHPHPGRWSCCPHCLQQWDMWPQVALGAHPSSQVFLRFAYADVLLYRPSQYDKALLWMLNKFKVFEAQYSLELGVVWKHLNEGHNLNGAHNSLIDAKAHTDVYSSPSIFCTLYQYMGRCGRRRCSISTQFINLVLRFLKTQHIIKQKLIRTSQ